MKESDLASLFSAYLRKADKLPNVLTKSALIEFKIKKGKTALHLVRDMQPHQIPTLLKVEDGCIYHKISDMSPGAKPSDAFLICHSPGFIAVMWYKPRQPKMLYLIRAIKLKQLTKLTELDAIKLCEISIKL